MFCCFEARDSACDSALEIVDLEGRTIQCMEKNYVVLTWLCACHNKASGTAVLLKVGQSILTMIFVFGFMLLGTRASQSCTSYQSTKSIFTL